MTTDGSNTRADISYQRRRKPIPIHESNIKLQTIAFQVLFQFDFL